MGKGRKKPFIDKSKATTYNLLYRASEVTVEGEDAGPERELVDVSRRVGIGRPDAEAAAAAGPSGGGRYPSGHPLAFLQVRQAWHDTCRATCTCCSLHALANVSCCRAASHRWQHAAPSPSAASVPW